MGIRKELEGKVMTVLGPVRGEDLGFTLPHEHLLVDISLYFNEPKSDAHKLIAYQPLSLETLRWARYHVRQHLDNTRQQDPDLAIRELIPYKIAGGKTIVENTSSNGGRDAEGLAYISKATGINIIMGAGHYVTTARKHDVETQLEEEVFDEIMSDIENICRIYFFIIFTPHFRMWRKWRRRWGNTGYFIQWPYNPGYHNRG